MNHVEKRRQLLKWLDKIEADTRRLVLDHHIYKEVRNIVAANRKLDNGYFFTWMFDNFVVASAMAVRRQVDLRSDVISLIRFLMKLKDNPDLVSRRYHVELCLKGNSKLPEDIHHDTYDRLVGKGQNKLCPKQIDSEIKELEEKAKLIQTLANKKFAHSGVSGPPKELPTFEHLEECLDFFEELVKKYLVLMRGISMGSLLPTFQYDWKQPLRLPWIATEPERENS